MEFRSNCQKCDAPIPYSGAGTPARYCLEHAERSNAARREKALQKRAGLAADAESVLTGNGPLRPENENRAAANEAWRASAPELLAIGLGVNADPEKAAKIVGLDLSPEELIAALDEAKSKYAGLTERKPAALSQALYTSLTLAVVRARCTISSLAPAQAGALAKSLAQTMELVVGGVTPAYSDLTIVIPGPDGKPVNMTSFSDDKSE